MYGWRVFFPNLSKVPMLKGSIFCISVFGREEGGHCFGEPDRVKNSHVHQTGIRIEVNNRANLEIVSFTFVTIKTKRRTSWRNREQSVTSLGFVSPQSAPKCIRWFLVIIGTVMSVRYSWSICSRSNQDEGSSSPICFCWHMTVSSVVRKETMFSQVVHDTAKKRRNEILLPKSCLYLCWIRSIRRATSSRSKVESSKCVPTTITVARGTRV